MIHYCMLWYINTLGRLHPFFAWHKRGERVFREALRGRGIFFTVVGISKVILWQADSFLKLKHPRNIQYWLIKISMKYGSIGHVVQKSYSNEVCVGWLHENCCLVGEMNLWWEGNENVMRGGGGGGGGGQSSPIDAFNSECASQHTYYWFDAFKKLQAPLLFKKII